MKILEYSNAMQRVVKTYVILSRRNITVLMIHGESIMDTCQILGARIMCHILGAITILLTLHDLYVTGLVNCERTSNHIESLNIPDKRLVDSQKFTSSIRIQFNT